MPVTPDTVIAFDFGMRRIGVAVGQRVTGTASPLATVSNGSQGPDWASISRLVEEWRPAHLVVGLPVHADGSESETGVLARRFAADLARFELPVDMVDERFSSREATARLAEARADGRRGRVGKADIDAAAAALIAERWLKTAH